MPRESNLEFKVGVFVLLGVILLGFFIFSVGGVSFLNEEKIVTVIFDFANGLKKNAPVRIAGVDKGIVKNIDLFFDRRDSKTKAHVELSVEDEVQIPEDSVIMINQLGLMGEKYVEIFPGTNTDLFYEEKQIIVGKDPIAQEVLAERIMEVANKLERSIEGVNNVIGDEQKMNAVGKTIDNLDKMTGQINEIVHKLNEGNGTAGKLLFDDTLYENMVGITADLNDIFYNIKQGKGTIGKLLYDERLYSDLEELSADLKNNPWKIIHRPKRK